MNISHRGFHLVYKRIFEVTFGLAVLVDLLLNQKILRFSHSFYEFLSSRIGYVSRSGNTSVCGTFHSSEQGQFVALLDRDNPSLITIGF